MKKSNYPKRMEHKVIDLNQLDHMTTNFLKVARPPAFLFWYFLWQYTL